VLVHCYHLNAGPDFTTELLAFGWFGVDADGHDVVLCDVTGHKSHRP
jgi:hypothetical protein